MLQRIGFRRAVLCCALTIGLVGSLAGIVHSAEEYTENPGTAGNGNHTVGPSYTIDLDLTDQGNPKGKLFEFSMRLADSKIFPGDDPTLDARKPVRKERKIFVYVPAAYQDGTKAPILVTLDGPSRLDLVRHALDNLTISPDPDRRLPAFIAIAVENGGDDGKGSQRGLEYDTMSDRFARFINDEVLPAVLNQPEIKAAYPNIAFTQNPWGKAVMGCSSGGAAALSMGWFRPDLFRRLITYSGTFVDQQDDDAPEEAAYPLGAWEYHSSMRLIENSDKKPLRIFTHVSESDLRADDPEETYHNWVMANQRTAAALKAKGYDYRFVFSRATRHCDRKVFESTLADTLVWMWRGYRPDASDRAAQSVVPQGKVTSGIFSDSRVFPGTRRDYSVYVPAQYTADQPASLMVFMDGRNYAKADGAFRVPAVLDDLIHQRAMPVTIAVFVDPGTIPATKPGASDRSNRSFEYDSLGDRYANFLIDEFLPVALDGLNVSSDAKQRAVCGISSGGICAFTVAWERPDQFGKVISHIGSFTNIRGGWAYPGLVRKTKDNPKPIKVYLQEGTDDLNNLFGNWPLANQDLAAALQFAGYQHQLVMTEGGHSGTWGGKLLPEALRWLWSDDSATGQPQPTQTSPQWQPHPDAVPRSDVPQGTVHSMPPWESQIFANTIRDWSIYVPAQYRPEQPAALMVFQDGERFRNLQGRWRVPIVFDNLIARGDMPPTIAVFIDPGHDKRTPRPRGGKASNRGFEYDSLGDRYTRLLLEEILPEVEKRYNISPDPAMRAIGGSSSGAICAFTAAWERPDAFQKVFSNVGSFTNLRGGNVYPSLVRKTEPKPIRVYMADTSGDVDNAFGSWPLANQLMASALQYMGYDVRFDWAEGYGHNPDFGGGRFPEAMRWLWRKEPHQSVLDTRGDLKGDMTLLRLLIPGQSWEPVADDLGFADAPCCDADGNFYFCDMKAPAVYRISAADGTRTEVAKVAVSGLEFGPDGRLYGCQGAQQRVISIDVNSGTVDTVATGVTPNDLAITADGFLFITETKDQRITRVNLKTREVVPVDTGITRPNGIALANDQGTLAVSDAGGDHVWTFRLGADGALDAKMPTMTMRLPIDPEGEFRFNEPPPYMTASRGDGMAVDKAGRYYVTSAVGVQIFDPTGRQCGVLPKPDQAQPLTSCILAGPQHQYLYVTNGTTVYRRKLMVD